MRDYDYTSKWQKLLTPEIVSTITQLHEFKGKQSLFVASKSDALTGLLKIAKIQSTEASNRIEGIYTSDKRIKLLVLDKTTPVSRDEQEIAGYRDVLATIHDSYEHIPLKPSLILQLHRDLYKYTGSSPGGKYKNTNNFIAEVDEGGKKRVHFEPVEAWETDEAMDSLCKAYNDIISDGKVSQAIILSMFILDFLCIHPFNDGNGRMSRLLTLLLLYRADYSVGKYISIEKIIEQTKETYYEALEASSTLWHENENNYAPFVHYMLGIILAAYRDFQSRVDVLTTKGLSKPKRVEEVIKTSLGTISKHEILKKCPDISVVTVQRTLNGLVKNQKILKISGGRYTKYAWNHEKME